MLFSNHGKLLFQENQSHHPIMPGSACTVTGNRVHGSLLLLLLLLQCGDIEANPGPPRRRPDAAAAKGPSTEEKIDALSRYDSDMV